MAQSTAPPKAVTLRNFSRRPRVPSVPPQQRMHIIDGAWMACFGVVSLIVAFATGGVSVLALPQTYLAALTVVFLYVLGFRVRDRATAVVASALLSTSPLFAATQIDSVRSSLFVLFTVLALTAYATAPYAAAAELVAVIMAAGATIMRPEGFLLGAVLVGFAITDKRPGGIVGFAIYLVLTFTGMGAMLVSTHRHFPMPTFALTAGPLMSLVDKPNVLLSCFVIALLGDLAEPVRRKRLKPVLLWAALFIGAESIFRFSGSSFDAGPFRPILFLLAAGGIARILPVVAGEFANPALRYGVAVMFVGILIATRFGGEWASAKSMVAGTMERIAQLAQAKKMAAVKTSNPIAVTAPRSSKPASIAKPPTPPHVALPVVPPVVHAVKPAPPTLKPVVVAHNVGVVPPGTVHHYVVVPPGALKPVPGVSPALVAAAAAAGVPTYTSHSGKMVARSPWSIKWDIAHRPKTASKPVATPVAAKPAPKPVAVVHPTPAPPKPVVVAKAPVKPAPHVVIAPKPAPKPVAKIAPAVVHPAAAPANSLEAQAAAAGVPTYHIVRGRKVMRNAWAVKWDIAHKAKPKHPVIQTPAPPKPKAAAPVVHTPATIAKPAAKPRAATAKPVAHVAAVRHAAVKPVRRAAAHKWIKPHAKRWTPPHQAKRPVHARHRSKWAILWHRAHPGH